MPGVLATPHLGASTEEAQAQVAVEGVGLLVDFLTTGAIRHAVNMTSARSPKRWTAARLSRRRAIGWGCCWRSSTRACAEALHAALSRRSGRARTRKLITASFRRRPAGTRAGRRRQHRQRRSAAARARHRTGRSSAAATSGAFSSVVLAEVEPKGDPQGGRHPVRPQHAAAGAARRLPARSLSRRRAVGLHPPATCRASSARWARFSARTRSTSPKWPSAAKPRGAKRSAC